MSYEIRGTLRDPKGNLLSKLFVEAFHSDLGLFERYLGNSWTDANGRFDIRFNEEAFEPLLERILRRRPDEHIVVRDSHHILYKSEIRRGANDLETFDVVINDTPASYDPYSESLQREIAAFNEIEDTVDLSKVDPQRATTQMLRAISSWSYYTQPKVMELYGYPGPQVPRSPKEVPHDHNLPWHHTSNEVEHLQ
jgi:hypothetical protein